MRPALAFVALVGCAQPISNASFYEDAAFVRVVPSSAELAPPAGFEAPPEGASPLLQSAVAAAGDFVEATAPIGAVGDALRATPPTVRTADTRTWERLTIAWTGRDGVEIAWIRAVIVDGDALFDVVIDTASDPDGPYAPIADGWRLEDGEAHLAVDAAALAAALGHEPSLALSIDLVPTDGGKDVHVARTDGTLDIEAWVVRGTSFGFSADLALTEDGEVWPGTTFARNEPSGGRATGEVRPGDAVLGFEACWGPDGATAYVGGDPGILSEGQVTDCTLAP